jgi:alkylhydroperoxidase family enzyme
MVMAEGFTQEQVQSILEDVDGSNLIDEKTKMLLQLAKKINHESSKIHEGTIKILRDNGYTEEEIFETIAVTALFNFMDRMADALGAPVEGFQEMIKQMNDK